MQLLYLKRTIVWPDATQLESHRFPFSGELLDYARPSLDTKHSNRFHCRHELPRRGCSRRVRPDLFATKNRWAKGMRPKPDREQAASTAPRLDTY